MYCLRLSEIVTLSGDQNEVFESLVDFQLLITWNPTVKRIFSFSTFDFNGLINGSQLAKMKKSIPDMSLP